MATSTPWGMSQSSEQLIRGVMSYSTASHGGIHVSDKLLERIPVEFHYGFCGVRGWYEEDCDWAIVAYFIPEAFPKELDDIVYATLEHCNPEVLTFEPGLR